MAIFYNQATLIHNGQITNSNTTTADIQNALAITKTAIIDEYSENGNLAYLVSITNNRLTPVTNATLTDDLGAYEYGAGTLTPLEYVADSLLYFVDGAPAVGAVAAVSGNVLEISGINIPAGSNAQLIYNVKTNEFAPLEIGSQITNTASLGELTASETVSVMEASQLTITKCVNPDTVSATGELTYTFIIQNTGNAPAVATDDVRIVDTFDPALTITEVLFNTDAWVENTNYTYNQATGEFATLDGQITVPAATFTRSAETGAIIKTHGVSILTVRGTV